MNYERKKRFYMSLYKSGMCLQVVKWSTRRAYNHSVMDEMAEPHAREPVVLLIRTRFKCEPHVLRSRFVFVPCVTWASNPNSAQCPYPIIGVRTIYQNSVTCNIFTLPYISVDITFCFRNIYLLQI